MSNNLSNNLPTKIDLEEELNTLRESANIRKNSTAYLSQWSIDVLVDEEHEIEQIIKGKLEPIVLRYCVAGDYEGAKKFVGNSYEDMNTAGKVLLFRSILVHQQQNQK